jgi:phage replication O-like protein O
MPRGDRLKLKADPDDGTTPIANLLLEAVAVAKLSGTEKGTILYFWRRTYGWVVSAKRLKEIELPLTTLANHLGIDRKTAYSILKSLTDKKIIHRKSLGVGKGYRYSMNTDIKSWDSNSIDIPLLIKLGGVGSPTYSVNNRQSTELPIPVSAESPTQESVNSQTPSASESEGINKNNKETVKEISLSVNFAGTLQKLILQNNPKAKTPTDLSNWTKIFDDMLKIDKRLPEDIIAVMEWSQKDLFWRTNILSAGKLREKFDQLYMKWNANENGGIAYDNAFHAPQPTHERTTVIDGDAPVLTETN